jgi:integrase
VCGDLPVADVATEHVMSILEPIWRVKPETASRLRGRIEAVIDYASAREWRTGDNPARWRGHVANMLPSRNKVARPGHHAALPWAQMAGFMAALCAQGGVGSLALQFAILTAARTGEVMGARWSEVDLTEAVWNVPGERMKAGRPHRVPLSGPAIAVLRALAPLRVSSRDTDAYVFPGRRRGRPLSSMAMLMLLRRMGRGDLTAHGFRSTFRDWCAEATTHEGAVAEAALAHTVRDKVEAAYRRGDQFEKRRRLMAEWASFCAQPAEKLVDGTPI